MDKMHRPIIFKAKRVDNGQWVEGYYLQDKILNSRFIKDRTQHIIATLKKETQSETIKTMFYEIDPNTLSQYTGLEDKNGNKIWENDIVKTDEADWVAKVIYYTDAFICEDNIGGFSSMCNWDDFEVIGNKFDNPELV